MDKIKHHGIKGQQWGLQHGPPYPINKEDHRIIVKKGSEIRRITRYDESKSKGSAYVTYNDDDIQHYKGFFTQLLRAKNGPIHYNDPIWSVKMTAVDDLVGPSYSERVDYFIQVYNKDPKFREALAEQYKKSYHKLGPIDKYVERFNNMTEDELRDKGYKAFAKGLGGNDYGRAKYFLTLEKAGFSIVNDDLDGGTYGIEPALLLNRAKSVKYEGQEKVNFKESKEIWKKEGNKING